AFTTSCAPTDSFNGGFENTTAGNLPNCWSKILLGAVGTTASIKTITDATNVNTGSNSVMIATGNSVDETFSMILVSPNLGNLLEGKNRLKFYAKSLSSSSFDIVALDSNYTDANITYLTTINPSNTMQGSTYDIPVSLLSSSYTYIGFRITAQRNQSL